MFSQALDLDDTHVPSLVSAADLEDEGEVAARLYRRALLLAPSQVTALRNWARRCQDQGDLAQAQTLYQEALRVAPHDVASLNQMGLLLWDTAQDATGAVAAFRYKFSKVILM